MKYFLKKRYKIIITIILAFMAVVSILNAKNDSLIYDEDAHIPAGYSYLVTHDIRLNPEHPPMLKDFAAFPLLFIGPKFDTTQPFWGKNPDSAQWESGKVFLFQSGNDPDRIIFWARLPFILLSLILGLFIFKWAREFSGVYAGILALILYAFDPNILGHNHFVTTDLGIAAFMTFALYYFIKFVKEPTKKNIIVAGIFLGLMQLAKFSSVLLFPVMFLAAVIYPLVKIKKDRRESTLKFKMKNLGISIGWSAVVFFISLILVWIVYWINTYKMPSAKLVDIINYYFHPYDPNPLTIYSREFLFALNSIPLLSPLADYLFGIFRVFQRVAGGNVTYLLGEISTRGFLSYFPIVFIIKEPLITLFLILTASIAGLVKIIRTIFRKVGKYKETLAEYLRTHIAEFSMLVFILLYLFTSITGRLNIGFRHLFPILPFIYILVAKTITDLYKKINDRQIELLFNVSLGFMLLYLIFGTVFAYPSYTSYFNETVGGPKNGYKYVTDSNADWGQDLKRLRNWIDEYNKYAINSCKSTEKNNNSFTFNECLPGGKFQKISNDYGIIDKIRIDYFGMADIRYYIGDKYKMWWAAKRPIEAGWYAISTEFLQQNIYDKSIPKNQSYRWLQNKKPVYQVGTSMLIYYISAQELPALN